MVFGFFLYLPIPLCTGLTLPTFMLCSLQQFFAVPLTLVFFFFWLLAELGMHPVFLRNHQNQMWSLYAVEKAVWAAGLGHVLHACDKKYRHNAKVELTMYCVAVNGEDRAVSPTRTDRCWFTLNSSPPPHLPRPHTHHYVSIIDWRTPPQDAMIIPLAEWTLYFPIQFTCNFLALACENSFSFLLFFFAFPSNNKVW